jgi:hypothetical protein
MMRVESRAIILAWACRAQRGNIRIPGTRPAGIYTAGLAQRLVNIEDISGQRRSDHRLGDIDSSGAPHDFRLQTTR